MNNPLSPPCTMLSTTSPKKQIPSSNNFDAPPHELVLSFPQELNFKSLMITQRLDGNAGGKLDLIEIYGGGVKPLVSRKVKPDELRITIPFPDNTREKTLTIKFPSVLDGKHASIADLEIVAEP